MYCILQCDQKKLSLPIYFSTTYQDNIYRSNISRDLRERRLQTLIRKILSFEVNITHVKFIMYVGSDKSPIFFFNYLLKKTFKRLEMQFYNLYIIETKLK